MEHRIDCRGKLCGEPDLLAAKALLEQGMPKLTLVVDAESAKDNVVETAKSLGYLCHATQVKNDYLIEIYKRETIGSPLQLEEEKGDFVIAVMRDTLGEGDRELGQILIKGYFYALNETVPYPKTILFLNTGVRLTTENQGVIKQLKELEEKGVEIISCSTSLEYLGLKEKLKAGKIANMYTICEKMNRAKEVISI